MLAHAATNVYNDVSDDVIGADPSNTTASTPTPRFTLHSNGLLSRVEMTRLALSLCGRRCSWSNTCGSAWPGVILLACGPCPGTSLFVARRAAFGARRRRAAVAVGLGVLPVLGAAWLQTGFVDSGAILLCVPVSCWVAAILIVNEVPDAETDGRAQKRTLVVRWGADGARVIYRSLTC